MKRVSRSLIIAAGAVIALCGAADYADVFSLQSFWRHHHGLDLENDWRVLDIGANSGDYRVLFKLDGGMGMSAGGVPRLKIERLVDDRIQLLCEYERDAENTSAQRFAGDSGRFAERLDPALFRPLAEAMQRGTLAADQRSWNLGEQLAPTVDLATRLIERCEDNGRSANGA